MTTLELTPFTQKESSMKYELNSFTECGMPFSIMVEREMNTHNTGNSYKFGVLSLDNKTLSWLFYGEVVATNRIEALKLYQQLLLACQTQKIGRPFAYKVLRRK